MQTLKKENINLHQLKIESEKLTALHMMFWSNALRDHIENILIEDNRELINESIFMSLMLGIYRGMFYSYQREDHFEFLTKLALSDAGRINRKQGHENRKKKIDCQMTPFLNEAKEKWEKGDQAFHDQMAQYLMNKHQEIKSIFGSHTNTKQQLMKTLKPLAKKYNRLRGLKKKEI